MHKDCTSTLPHVAHAIWFSNMPNSTILQPLTVIPGIIKCRLPERLRAHPKPDARGIRVMEEPEYILCYSAVKLVKASQAKHTFTGIPVTVYGDWRPGTKTQVYFWTLKKSNMAVRSSTTLLQTVSCAELFFSSHLSNQIEKGTSH